MLISSIVLLIHTLTVVSAGPRCGCRRCRCRQLQSSSDSEFDVGWQPVLALWHTGAAEARPQRPSLMSKPAALHHHHHQQQLHLHWNQFNDYQSQTQFMHALLKILQGSSQSVDLSATELKTVDSDVNLCPVSSQRPHAPRQHLNISRRMCSHRFSFERAHHCSPKISGPYTSTAPESAAA
jgi:hypothetical protein